MVEHSLGKGEVGSSILLMGTKEKPGTKPGVGADISALGLATWMLNVFP